MIIEQFLNYLQYERNYSSLTLLNYGNDLRDFESYFKSLGDCLSWDSVDTDIVRGWMAGMMERGNHASSVKRRLSSLKSFYRFALKRGLLKEDPTRIIVGPKKGKPLPQFLREGEMDSLLDIKDWTDSYQDVLEKAIILTFYSTGIRLSELIGLDDNDVDFVDCRLLVTGKRSKQRVIPFGEELKQSLTDYLHTRKETVIKADEALFVGTDGSRLNANKIRYIVKKNLSLVSTLKKRTPHVLRHTFATSMLNHEAGLEGVQKLLGHASLETTQVYTHTTFEQLKRVYKHAHPRA